MTTSPYVLIVCEGGSTTAQRSQNFLGRLSGIKLREYDNVSLNQDDIALTSISSLIASFIENRRQTSDDITDININSIYSSTLTRFSSLLNIPEDELQEDYIETGNLNVALTSGILNIFTSIIAGANRNLNSDGISEIFSIIANTESDSSITSSEFIREVLINANFVENSLNLEVIELLCRMDLNTKLFLHDW